MLAAWMLYATALSLLAVGAALALEELLAIWGLPRRGLWIGAMLVAALLPIGLATRARPRVSAGARARLEAAAPALTGRVGQARPTSTVPWQLRVFRWSMRVDRRARGLWIVSSGLVALAFGGACASMLLRRRAWREGTLNGHRVLLTSDVGPAVVGFLRPRIVIPTWALERPEHERALMLDHEREHIVAGDPLLLLFAGVVLVLFPWNPALWWMARRLRVAIEIDCDARVIRRSDMPDEYGLFLVAVGERRMHGLFLAASLAERRSSLERRIYAMTKSPPRNPLLASLPFAALALGAATLAAQTPQPPAPAGNVIRAVAASAPADRIHLTVEQVRALVVAHHPTVANGSSEDNTLTIILAANGEYVVSGSSKAAAGGMGGFVTARPAQAASGATASSDETKPAVEARAAIEANQVARASVLTERPANPGFVTFAGIGDVDATLIKDMYWNNYAAGDVSTNPVRVRFVTLTGNRVK